MSSDELKKERCKTTARSATLYCEVHPVPPDDGEVLKQRLIQFFYSEKEFIRAIKKHNKIYLIEDLFRKGYCPG